MACLINGNLPKNKMLSKISESSMLTPEVKEYFSKLESSLHNVPEPKREELRKRLLNTNKLFDRISAYFELDIFNIFNFPPLKSKFFSPRPDLVTTLPDMTTISTECVVCKWFEGKEQKRFNKAWSILSEAHQQAIVKLGTNNKWDGLIIKDIFYKSEDLSSNEKNDLLKFLIDIYESGKNSLFDIHKIKFYCEHDPINKNLLTIKNSSFSSKKLNSLLSILKRKVPDRNITDPYFIAVCLWGWEGAFIPRLNSEGTNEIEIIIPKFNDMVSKFFHDNKRVNGIFLFPSNWFPLSGTLYLNGQEILQPTCFQEKIINKFNGEDKCWVTMVPWKEEKRYFIYIKNLKCKTKAPLSFENSISRHVNFFIGKL